ncbi:hypothetical protein O6H91_03G067900 [Diphasiastrum complanatum]|uniref:Uncharacterized protein n=2 Tax=Diphasiastrum complanatum TaxID=34168 RepID=A0ACC2E7B0_DIPCM|nr:hypothetical protein O6H91_Y087700 [Diphasiastrum complanatum]KAJ7562392.1 hypothetical protein O6H91_03G067900 [Diphasiastrum complanatum]KAJ7562395.1 hypothetical protein O6H91_03G067900 [Diphasiastrum complanatum]
MFWRMAGLSTTSPVESVLDKEVYTLEELLDEEDIIQECKATNGRLINYLQGRLQVHQMIHYVIDEPPEGADDKRTFKFPFISCEIFTCEIEAILKTVVEDEELMDLIFSFLDANRPHGTLLAGYFSKVVICLLLRKTVLMVGYLQTHQDILKKLVDLIGITSIMEVLMRLVGADDIISTFHANSLQWLADTDLLEMLVDKLSSPNSSEIHANAAEILSAVTRAAPSSLSYKLSSPGFISRLFTHALEDPQSKSTLVHSLSVCISLLNPKRPATLAAGGARVQHALEPAPASNPEIIDGMLQRFGDLLRLLDVSVDDRVLPTTYGELRPPFGINRLKIVEFVAVLLRTKSEAVRQELIRLEAIRTIVNFFFAYPFNNMLHHHVESIINSCIDSNSPILVDNLFKDCDFISRLLAADANPYAPDTRPEPRASTSKPPPRIGNMGHLMRIANKLVQVGSSNPQIQSYLQENSEWMKWHSTVLHNRNMLENVYQWTCGRPTAVQERRVDSDEDDFRERDYDVSTIASNLTREVFRYGMFDNEEAEEGYGTIERDDEDVFFDDESAEVVISSLRLSDEQDSNRLKESMFGTDSSWFAFHDNSSKISPSCLEFSPPSRIDDDTVLNAISLPSSSDGSSSDDDVVVGEDDELVDTATSSNRFTSIADLDVRFSDATGQDGLRTTAKLEANAHSVEDICAELGEVGLDDSTFLQYKGRNSDLFSSESSSWAAFGESRNTEGTSGRDSFDHNNPFCHNFGTSVDGDSFSTHKVSENDSIFEMEVERNATSTLDDTALSSNSRNNDDHNETSALSFETGTDLFGSAKQLIGVEATGTAKAMEHALKEGVVGEAGPLFPKIIAPDKELETRMGDKVGSPEFNDVNYWRSEYQSAAVEEH